MQPDTLSDLIAARQERLRIRLQARKLPCLLVSNPTNIFYLTGFRGSAGIAAFSHSDAALWVDPRYTLQAHEQAHGVTVFEERGELLKAAGQWLGRRRLNAAGYEDGNLTCAGYRRLRNYVPRGIRLYPAGGLVEDARRVKDAIEVEQIRRAGRLTAEVFQQVRSQIRPEVRESDLAAEIEYRMRRAGADGAAFETIVASGVRSAWPHARASSKLLKKNELVIFDLGAILNGYAADMTRSVYLGVPPPRARRLYNAVLEAQQRAMEAAEAGGETGDIDRAARRVLRHSRLERFFTHSTGHGVGLEIHESPRVARRDRTRLEPGFVITIEPGVYMEGFGGIRIEDTVLVGEGQPEILTPAPKDDWIIA
ncbi:MAG: M24 family metallopeptidase [Terriglobia bacterium]